MRKFFIISLLLIFALPIMAENVTNVRVRQEGKAMVITYDLNHHADIRLLMIHDGLNNFIELKNTKGDVGKGILSGKDRSIIWEPLEEYDKFIAKGVRFMVDVVTQSKHAYVDLGLSVKWATCNVGASKPEEAGDYFAWGETRPKSHYDWSTYKYCFNGSKRKITKYNSICKYGYEKYVDNDSILDLSDDAAYMNWGGSWRMPTKKEWLELINNCTVTYEEQKGLLKLTSKVNGNSIFLLAYNDDFSIIIESRYYWSSTRDYKHCDQAWTFKVYRWPGMDIIGGGDDCKYWTSYLANERCYRGLVRPVCP